MLSCFPRGVLDEILNLIESVSEDFPSYFFNFFIIVMNDVMNYSLLTLNLVAFYAKLNEI